jgi:hypothetical protein
MYDDHYSDDLEASLAYYLIFQLEEDPTLLQKYKAGYNAYWRTISQSENPFFYPIYQLTEPKNTDLVDAFGSNLIENAAWTISRIPIDLTAYSAYVYGSRPDVLFEGNLAVYPEFIGDRLSETDAKFSDVPKNHDIWVGFDPKKIYKINPLAADERKISKYNQATYVNVDKANALNKESATLFTLPYWFSVYHNMIQFDI